MPRGGSRAALTDPHGGATDRRGSIVSAAVGCFAVLEDCDVLVDLVQKIEGLSKKQQLTEACRYRDVVGSTSLLMRSRREACASRGICCSS
jgi:hypothetical protein